MRDDARLKLIQEIEAKRGSQVVVYVTSYRPGQYGAGSVESSDVRIIEKHLQALGLDKSGDLDLFICTPGGLAIVPWALVTLIREYLGKRRFATLVPAKAMSAGTKICLGADEIIMGPGGSLGPIDTQYGYMSVEDIEAYLAVARRWSVLSWLVGNKTFAQLTEWMPPTLIGRLHRARSEGERVAMRLLGSRRRPLSRSTNRRISKYLLNQVGLHGQSIRRKEARSIGMSFVRDAENAGISGHMAQLFNAYEELMALDRPFARPRLPDPVMESNPDLVDFDVTGEHTMDIPAAVVESTARLDIGYYAYDHRFWSDKPDRPDLPVGAPAEAPADAEEGQNLSGPQLSVHWRRDDD